MTISSRLKGIGFEGEHMTNGFGITLLASLFVFAGFSAQAVEIKPKVIYGADDRRDVYEVSDAALREVADSTVAMIANNRLSPNGRGGLKVSNKIYGTDYRLCRNEPFYSQPIAAMCSGFLVGDDLIATAGHCIQARSCAQYSFAFGYKMDSASSGPESLPESEVYRCKEVLVSEQLTRGQDYALVRLDRPVRGHRVLNMASSAARVGDDLVVIGHPAGLPTKIAGGGKVRSSQSAFFVANLDTYGGNSGSAVFDATSLDVVGILVRGERDFAYDSAAGCQRSNICRDDACRGEDVTHISYVQGAMPSAVQ